METPIYLWVLVCVAVGGLVGHAIGRYRGRAAAGAVWGALLGLIGWLVIAAGPDYRPRCPECQGVVVPGARKCKNCGSDLPSELEALAEPDMTPDARYEPWKD